MKAMLFAAGLGTRLKQETREKPKSLVEIGGKTLLQHSIEKLDKEGISEIVVNVHHFSGLMKSFLSDHDFGVKVTVSDETDELLETGGGLKKAAPLLESDEPVVLYNVDILSNLNLKDVLEYHNKNNALATLVVRDRQTQRYFKFNSQNRLAGWVNKKTGETKVSIPCDFGDATSMAFSGIHVINPEILKLLPNEKRFSITDWYLNLAQNHFIQGYFDTSSLWMDVGKPEQLAEARKRFSK